MGASEQSSIKLGKMLKFLNTVKELVVNRFSNYVTDIISYNKETLEVLQLRYKENWPLVTFYQ